MEEFKKILHLACVPSLPALLVCINTVLAGFSLYHGGRYLIPFTVALSIITVALLVPVVRRSIIFNGDTNARNLARGAIYAALLVAMCAAILHNMPASTRGNLLPDKKQTFTGTVELVRLRRYSREVLVDFCRKDVENSRIFHGISFTGPDLRLNRGDTIEFNVKPKIIGSGNKPATAYETSLLRKGISCFLYLNEKNCSVIQPASPGTRERLRQGLARIINSTFNEDTAPLVKALYFGNRNWIDKRTVESFRRAGVLHVLAASGLHVGILASIPLLVLGFFSMNRNMILCITTLILSGYLYITDMPVSLMRAFVMFTVFMVQSLLFADRNILNTLFLAALFILVLFPAELFNPGFQLSFGATLGIILFYPVYLDTLSFMPKIISGPAAVTLSAQIIVVPVIILHFHELNLISVISNLLIVPVTALFLGISIFSCTVSMISIQAAGLFGSAADATCSILRIMVDFMAGLHGHFSVEKIHPFLIISFIILLLPLTRPRGKRRITSPVILGSIIICWTILRPGPAAAESGAVIFTQAQAIAMLHVNGRQGTLIGQISGREMADNILRIIREKGLDETMLLIPFPDYSNIRGFTRIAKNTVISECRLSPLLYFNRSLNSFINVLDKDRVPLRLETFNRSSVHLNYAKKTIIEIDSPDAIKYIYSRLKSGEKAENFTSIPLEYL